MIRPNPTPPAHHTAPPGTSEVAARRITHAAPTLRDRVLRAIREAGPDGLTDDEGETRTRLKPQSYTPRRGELVKLGLIVATDRRRPTGSGRPACVWVASEHAKPARN